MATILSFLSGRQITDDDGEPVSGALLYHYQAGTTNNLTVYSNQAGSTPHAQPVECDAGGFVPLVYVDDSSDWKVVIETPEGATLRTYDDLPKAVTEVSAADFAPPLLDWTQVNSASSPVALTAADAGKAYEANTSSGSVEFDLPSAASVGNGKGFLFKKTSGSNTLTIDPNGTETIDDVATSFSVDAKDAVVGIFSNGAEWYIVDGYGLLRFINNYTEDTTPDTEADFIGSYDASAGLEKKVKLKNVPGRVIQRFYTSSSSFSTTTQLPADGTIPQITEGGELFSQAITPKSATNRIRVTIAASLTTSLSDPGVIGLALFNGAESAIAAAASEQFDNGEARCLTIVYEAAAGSTSPITFSARAGVNGAGTTSLFTGHGAISVASMVIEEIVP